MAPWLRKTPLRNVRKKQTSSDFTKWCGINGNHLTQRVYSTKIATEYRNHPPCPLIYGAGLQGSCTTGIPKAQCSTA